MIGLTMRSVTVFSNTPFWLQWKKCSCCQQNPKTTGEAAFILVCCCDKYHQMLRRQVCPFCSLAQGWKNAVAYSNRAIKNMECANVFLHGRVYMFALNIHWKFRTPGLVPTCLFFFRPNEIMMFSHACLGRVGCFLAMGCFGLPHFRLA